MTLSPPTPSPATPAPPRPDRSRSGSLRPLLVRLHFYAGVLVAPFILVAAVTGGLYALATPLERLVYADELTATAPGEAQDLAAQVAAAREAQPDLPLLAVRPASEAERTTRVLFDDGRAVDGKRLAVFVDPASAEVTGELTAYGTSGVLPLVTWIDDLHRSLHLGDVGRLYSELAASWLGVVALAGVLLWWTGPRRGSPASRLRPARTGSARRRTLSWHGALGTWLLLGMLMLSATGLTWSQYAGANVTDLRAALSWSTPAVVADLDGDPDPHAGHGGHGGHDAPSDPDDSDGADGPGVGFDGAAVAAAGEGLSGPVEISQPEPGAAYVVSELDRSWPTQADAVAVDPEDGSVLDVVRFDDYPFAAKLARWGVDLHMGVLFGLASQVGLALLAAGIAAMTVWGYRMWWLRRPTRATTGRPGRAPRRGAWAEASPYALTGVGLAALVAGWFVPLLGLSLALFLAVDLALGWRATRRATVDPTDHDETLEDAR